MPGSFVVAALKTGLYTWKLLRLQVSSALRHKHHSELDQQALWCYDQIAKALPSIITE